MGVKITINVSLLDIHQQYNITYYSSIDNLTFIDILFINMFIYEKMVISNLLLHYLNVQ